MVNPTINAFLGLGSNLGKPKEQIALAFSLLGKAQGIKVLKKSNLMESRPWGKTDQPDFINACVWIETSLSPLALLDTVLGIEQEMGRVRGAEKWGPRLIDIDILFYDGLKTYSDERLTLPHPHALERDFVMEPLAQIAPEFIAALKIATAIS